MPTVPDPKEQPTMALWPDTGRAIGLGRGATYAAAARGDIPTVPAGGHKKRVPTALLRQMLGLDLTDDAA